MFSYIDPGTGSLLLQVLLAGVVGTVAFFRRSITAFLRVFVSTKETKEKPTTDEFGT